MAFILLIIGLLLTITSAKDTHVEFGKQVVKDFTGEGNFITWVMAISGVGSIGYVEKFRPVANAFLALILITMVLTNSRRGDLLTQIQKGLMNPVPPKQPEPVKPPEAGVSKAPAGEGDGGSGIGAAAGTALGSVYGGPIGGAIGGSIGGALEESITK